VLNLLQVDFSGVVVDMDDGWEHISSVIFGMRRGTLTPRIDVAG
jgi:hypothetical protein